MRYAIIQKHDTKQAISKPQVIHSLANVFSRLKVQILNEFRCDRYEPVSGNERLNEKQVTLAELLL